MAWNFIGTDVGGGIVVLVYPVVGNDIIDVEDMVGIADDVGMVMVGKVVMEGIVVGSDVVDITGVDVVLSSGASRLMRPVVSSTGTEEELILG